MTYWFDMGIHYESLSLIYYGIMEARKYIDNQAVAFLCHSLYLQPMDRHMLYFILYLILICSEMENMYNNCGLNIHLHYTQISLDFLALYLIIHLIIYMALYLKPISFLQVLKIVPFSTCLYTISTSLVTTNR